MYNKQPYHCFLPMSNPRFRDLEASPTMDCESDDQKKFVSRRRLGFKSILLSFMLGLNACATTSYASPRVPAVNSAKPTGIRPSPKAKPKPQPQPKSKSNPQPQPEHENGGGYSPLNRERPTDCMDIDRDQPGACDIA
jgi:hypothetical protein